MKKRLKYLFLGILLVLFIPEVYAFSYDINTNTKNTSVKKGTVSEIKVSLDNIKGDNDGIVACSMSISFIGDVALDSKVRTLNSWTMTAGRIFMFDTGDFVFDRSDMFVIPVKVNGAGSVKLSEIVCSDAVTEETTADKEVKFTVLTENKQPSGNTGGNSNPVTTEKVKDSNANLSDIRLSEGTIEFDPNITDYEIEVDNFEKLEVNPITESSKSQIIVDKNILIDSNNIVITVTAENGNTKVYNIKVLKPESVNDSDDKGISTNNSNNKYLPIFIGIIVLLVIVNIIRILFKKRKEV